MIVHSSDPPLPLPQPCAVPVPYFIILCNGYNNAMLAHNVVCTLPDMRNPLAKMRWSFFSHSKVLRRVCATTFGVDLTIGKLRIVSCPVVHPNQKLSESKIQTRCTVN